MNSKSLPTVVLRPSSKPGFVQVHWRCFACGNPHRWIWPLFDGCDDEPVWMRCDHCGEQQRTLFPSHLPAEIQLAQRVADRDTDTAEALIEPAAARCNQATPRQQRTTRPVIQHGLLLGRELHALSALIERREWALLEQQCEHYATITGWACNALTEFGG